MRYHFAPPPAVDNIEDRCAPRFRVVIPGQLRPTGERAFAVTVRDLSAAGFQAEAVTSMRPGHRCWLTIASFGAMQAEVVWNDGVHIGCAFHQILNQAVVDTIIDRAA